MQPHPRQQGTSAADTAPVEDADDEVIICFTTEKSRLAIAMYEAATDVISFTSQDFWSTADLEWQLQCVFTQVASPSVILTGRGISASTEAMLRRSLRHKAAPNSALADSLPPPATGAGDFDGDGEGDPELSPGGGSMVIPTAAGSSTDPGSVDADAGQSARLVQKHLRFLAKSAFSFGRGCALLSRLKVLDLPQLSPGQDAMLFMRSVVNMEDRVSVQSLAGIIGYLMESAARNALEPSSEGLTVQSMRQLCLASCMHISSISFAALNIFSKDSHPSVVKGSGRSKEGFSLFALLDQTASVAGQKLLKQWMLRPVLDLEEISRRHDMVEQLLLMKTHHVESVKQLKLWLRNMRDLPRLVQRLSAAKATVGDWVALKDTVNSLCGAVRLLSTMQRDLVYLMTGRDVNDPAVVATQTAEAEASTTPATKGTPCAAFQIPNTVFTAILAISGTQVEWTQEMLSTVVDWETTTAEGRVCILNGLDANLDEYRSAHMDLSDFLAKIAVQEIQDYEFLSSASVAYIPQIGFLLALLKDDYEDLGALGTRPELEYQYEIKSVVYYKTARMKELDEFFGDIASVIIDMEDGIVRQLLAKLLDFSPVLLQLGAAFAELDCLMSFADACSDLRFVRPEMTDDNVIYIKNGRHPLQEVIVSTFVPNDAALSPGTLPGGVAVISGANFSGKSVYIKQVGLICYMAQIGCFVPAERAILGVVDRMFTRIQTIDSTLRPESTFTSDIHQVAQMLNHCTTRSLLLVDEFGKGTSAVDGSALLLALVKHLVKRQGTGPGVPKVMITTHFGDVFDYEFISPEDLAELAFYQMEIILEKSTLDRMHSSARAGSSATLSPLRPGEKEVVDWEQVTPLFRIIPGRCSSSFGIACAQQAGLSPDLLLRAQVVTSSLKNRVPITADPRITEMIRLRAAGGSASS